MYEVNGHNEAELSLFQGPARRLRVYDGEEVTKSRPATIPHLKS